MKMVYSLVLIVLSLASCVLSVTINPPGCGRRPLQPAVGKRNTGSQVASGDWGWHVAILIDGSYRCGGVLINDQWVLTAASCLGGTLVLYTVRISSDSMLTNYTYTVIQSFTSTSVYRNTANKYNSTTRYNDIALMKLPTRLTNSFTTDNYTIPACVWTNTTADLVNTLGYSTGFGTRVYLGVNSDYLNVVDLRINNASYCTNVFKYYNDTVQLCAGSDTHDNCLGDFGGPLVINYNGLYYLAGIISYTPTCGGASVGTIGSVMTRVSQYASWIASVV